MTVKWLVDQYMLDHNEQDVLGLLQSAGFEVKVGTFDRLARGNEIPKYYESDECVVIYGSLEFVAQQQKHGYIPGAYYQEKALHCSSYIPQIPENYLLNSEHVFATFADFCRRPDFFYRAFANDHLFIRPNTGRKLFTGLSIARNDFEDEINSLRQLSGVSEDSLIVVAKQQTIEAEYRFFIVNRKVITGSFYEHEETQSSGDALKEVPVEAWQMAQAMAKNPWQPDIGYVCDVAKTPEGFKIVELNALSCSGLYNCDIVTLAKAVSVAAELEYDGELNIGDLEINAFSLRP